MSASLNRASPLLVKFDFGDLFFCDLDGAGSAQVADDQSLFEKTLLQNTRQLEGFVARGFADETWFHRFSLSQPGSQCFLPVAFNLSELNHENLNST